MSTDDPFSTRRLRAVWRSLEPRPRRSAGALPLACDGDTLLDVGAGTGSIAAAVASRPAIRIVGLDPAAAYVAFAQASTATNGLGSLSATVSEPFHDGAFDRTLSLLAINFVPDPQQAAAEMTRVTRRGGIVAAAWDYGEGMEMLRVFWDTVVALRPTDAQKDERHMRLCRHGELATLWRSRDLQDVTEDALTVTTASRHSMITGLVSAEAGARWTLRRGADGVGSRSAAASVATSADGRRADHAHADRPGMGDAWCRCVTRGVASFSTAAQTRSRFLPTAWRCRLRCSRAERARS